MTIVNLTRQSVDVETFTAVHIGLADVIAFTRLADGVGSELLGDYSIDGDSWALWGEAADRDCAKHIVIRTQVSETVVRVLQRLDGEAFQLEPIAPVIDLDTRAPRIVSTLLEDWSVVVDAA